MLFNVSCGIGRKSYTVGTFHKILSTIFAALLLKRKIKWVLIGMKCTLTDRMPLVDGRDVYNGAPLS